MRSRWVALLFLTSFGGACGDGPTQVETWPEPPPDVTAYVTGAALENLDDNGHFRLSSPTVASPYPTITGLQAQEIALGVIRTWYANPDAVTLPGTGSLTASAERQHGAAIDWPAVDRGPREPYFAESHLEPLPLEAGLPAIRHYGPRFLVPLYVGVEPVALVSVSAYATNTSIDDRGFVRRVGDPTGGEFRVGGIPLSLEGVTLPPSPEVAVEYAATQTGAKVAEFPVLGTPGNFVSSLGSRWRLMLDRDVEFERVVDGELVGSREVFVGAWPSIADARLGLQSSGARLRLFVAAADQPESQDLEPVDGVIRSGYAVDLHEVRVR